MKDIFKSFLALLVFASAFFIGCYIGEEKVKSKISEFQKDSDEGVR